MPRASKNSILGRLRAAETGVDRKRSTLGVLTGVVCRQSLWRVGATGRAGRGHQRGEDESASRGWRPRAP